jgi:hypothetical protein
MNNAMLLMDCVGYTTLSLNESSGGCARFRGKFQEANVVNKNRRMYTLDILSSNVESLAETIKERGLVGELDHPTDSIVHLANTSHLVTKLWWEGNVLMGEGEILNTPSGKILKSLIEQGVRIGISSRGVGNGQVNNEGVLVIGESYKLITFDCVIDPSTPKAFQKMMKGENASYYINNEYKPQVVESVNTKVNHRALVSFFGATLDTKLKETIKIMRTK